MNELPPRVQSAKDQDRQYRTALQGQYYLDLEREATERGITPYRLTQIIMTKYLKGELLIKDEK